MAKKLFIILLILVIALLALRNTIVKAALCAYIESRLGGECSINKAVLLPGELALYDTVYKSSDTTILIETVSLEFSAFRGFIPSRIRISLRQGTVAVDDFREFLTHVIGTDPKGTRRMRTAHAKKPLTLTLDLHDVAVSLTNVRKTDISGTVSCAAVLRAGHLQSIDTLALTEGRVRHENFELSGMAIEAHEENGFSLHIPSLAIKEKEIKDISALFTLPAAGVRVFSIRSPALGERGRIRGTLDYSDYTNICFDVQAEDIVVGEAIAPFVKENTFSMRGDFSGGAAGCITDGELTLSDIVLSNTTGGFINIQKGASFDFLKERLTEKSYNAVVDGFQDYKYNKGTITVSKEATGWRVALLTDSETMGKRDIVISIHNSGGDR